MIRQQSKQIGLADSFIVQPRLVSILDKIDTIIDWEPIRRRIEELYRLDGPGRPAFPAISLFKTLLLQGWHDLSDYAAEAAVGDRLSFRRFIGLTLEEQAPDHSTIHRFRDRIAPIMPELFALVNQQLEDKGFVLKKGSLVDATLLQSVAHPPAKGEGSHDPDASWGGPQVKQVYGYKGHVGMDQESELIRQADMTPAHQHDTQSFRDMVSGDEQAAYADKAYRSQSHSNWLQEQDIHDGIMHQAQHPRKLSDVDIERNRRITKIRRAVEHFFGTLKRIYRYRRCRYWTLMRNRCGFLVLCSCYNMKRVVKLASA